MNKRTRKVEAAKKAADASKRRGISRRLELEDRSHEGITNRANTFANRHRAVLRNACRGRFDRGEQ